MRLAAGIVIFGTALVLAACGGGGGGGGTSSPPVASTPPPPLTGQAAIEQSLGTLLQRPVFQCGTGTDTITGDAAPASVTVF